MSPFQISIEARSTTQFRRFFTAREGAPNPTKYTHCHLPCQEENEEDQTLSSGEEGSEKTEGQCASGQKEERIAQPSIEPPVVSPSKQLGTVSAAEIESAIDDDSLMEEYLQMEQEALEKQKAASASTETDVEPCYFEHEDGTHPSFRTETDVDPCYTEPEDTREDKTRTGRSRRSGEAIRDNH